MTLLLDLVLDEGKWLATAMLLSLAAVLWRWGRQRRRGLPDRLDLLWAMNRFFGGVIAVMGTGHLLAVAVKSARGTLTGSLAVLVPLGLVLALPAWWLALGAGRLVADDAGRRTLLALNLFLGASLLAMGLHNLPLALPAALNVAYQLHSRRAVGWTIVTATVALQLALLVGALVFLASGQSFEQFQER